MDWMMSEMCLHHSDLVSYVKAEKQQQQQQKKKCVSLFQCLNFMGLIQVWFASVGGWKCLLKAGNSV